MAGFCCCNPALVCQGALPIVNIATILLGPGHVNLQRPLATPVATIVTGGIGHKHQFIVVNPTWKLTIAILNN